MCPVSPPHNYCTVIIALFVLYTSAFKEGIFAECVIIMRMQICILYSGRFSLIVYYLELSAIGVI